MSDAASAQMLAQVYEGLTVVDAEGVLRPALAESWSIADDGLSATFRLRPDLRFSDGTPIAAEDVRRSWLRFLDPSRPSPLSSVLDDVVGAAAHAAGETECRRGRDRGRRARPHGPIRPSGVVLPVGRCHAGPRGRVAELDRHLGPHRPRRRRRVGCVRADGRSTQPGRPRRERRVLGRPAGDRARDRPHRHRRSKPGRRLRGRGGRLDPDLRRQTLRGSGSTPSSGPTCVAATR